MSAVQIQGNAGGTGTLTIAAPSTNTNRTLTLPDGTGTFTVAGVNSNIVAGTSVATTSGTSVDFTSIPSWVKRITVMFNGVSQSSATPYGIIQIGAGSVTTTGYICTQTTLVAASTVTTLAFTSGFAYLNLNANTDTVNGIAVLTTLGSNVWVASGTINNATGLRGVIFSGNITLGGVLDRVRITTTDGTTTFDAGSINILYE